MGHFVVTDPTLLSPESEHEKIWEAIKSSFSGRDALGFWQYPIFSKIGQTRKEPDILIIDPGFGLIIVELVRATIEQVISVSEDQWTFRDYMFNSQSPWRQAEDHLFALLGYCDQPF